MPAIENGKVVNGNGTALTDAEIRKWVASKLDAEQKLAAKQQVPYGGIPEHLRALLEGQPSQVSGEPSPPPPPQMPSREEIAADIGRLSGGAKKARAQSLLDKERASATPRQAVVDDLLLIVGE